jgi:hypothetical protein
MLGISIIFCLVVLLQVVEMVAEGCTGKSVSENADSSACADVIA